MRYEASAVRPKVGACQKVAVGTASAASANAFGEQTRLVVVDADVGCHVAFGTAPTATTSDFHVTAGTPYLFIVDPGQKIAVIVDDGVSAGNLWVSEVTF